MTICAMSPGKLGFAMHFCEYNKIQIPGKISLLIRKFNWIFLWMFLYPKMRGKISWKNYTIAYSILINFYISRYCMEGIWPNIFFSKLDAIIIFRAHRSFVLYMACLFFFCSSRMVCFISFETSLFGISDFNRLLLIDDCIWCGSAQISKQVDLI